MFRKHGDDYPSKSFIICSALDMVNINATNVVCKDKATCEGSVNKSIFSSLVPFFSIYLTLGAFT